MKAKPVTFVGGWGKPALPIVVRRSTRMQSDHWVECVHCGHLHLKASLKKWPYCTTDCVGARGWKKLRGPLRPAKTIRLITKSLTFRELRTLQLVTSNAKNSVAFLLRPGRHGESREYAAYRALSIVEDAIKDQLAKLKARVCAGEDIQ
jgi:hypothetical protein